MFNKLKKHLDELLFKEEDLSSENFITISIKIKKKIDLLDNKSDLDSLKKKEVLETLLARAEKLAIKYR